MAKRPKLAPITESGSGSVNEKEKARLAEIIERVNGLFEGEITDDDQLVYVNNVLKGKLLESQELVTQAGNNTKAQLRTRRRYRMKSSTRSWTRSPRIRL